ncbi:acyltransferase [Leclercia adecarboxylata]|uniref:Acyltransferase n=1 Tax=Leclercia adecarboxylata TaxID=83655 RepID=A0A9X4BF75_9ENTR|nr:acyltransferase [Leclercia adecarboxylata]MBD1405735.1 acyltransferase [Leclercia adecarboxylata]MDC6623873.1 acyltransferase [Leclercia adecarboxylata]MDC6632695.1 acyltransferase [Leclercia adecarboxylata]MDC6639880.1 acyltransferase [Leclercia adecarboxylata]MDC6651627.1 acyltransferase [Leclercia adecarboxylata]
MNNDIAEFNNKIKTASISQLDQVFIYNQENIDFRTVKILGTQKRNYIIVEQGIILKNSIIDFRSENSIVYIKSDGVRANFLLGYGSCIYIDESTSFTNTANILASEGYDIYIGKDCMFAENINITNSDGHPIFDNSGMRVNEGGDIIIGNHVWIGRNTDILKNTTLDSGCIIGSRSVVTKNIPYASIAVGAPAQIKKRDVLFSKETTVRHEHVLFNEVKAYYPRKLMNNEKIFLLYIKDFIYKNNGIF